MNEIQSCKIQKSNLSSSDTLLVNSSTVQLTSYFSIHHVKKVNNTYHFLLPSKLKTFLRKGMTKRFGVLKWYKVNL